MTTEFTRIITLLRKEHGISQKQAAADLGVSQALLSHYENGRRECGLDFVVRVADYYGVSCDYLLGRSADRNGLMLTIEEVPNPETSRDTKYRGSVLPILHKKIIANGMNILFDKLTEYPNKALTNEISAYLMLAVYRMFRLVYSANPKNASSMFGVSRGRWQGYTNASMNLAEANVQAILAGEEFDEEPPVKDTSCFAMTTENISKDYPLHATSLFNLIKTSEARIDKTKP